MHRPLGPLPFPSRPLSRNAEEEVEDAVFAQSFIPRKLEEVAHYERDREALAAGQKVGF